MMLASLEDVACTNGKGGLALAGSLFPLSNFTHVAPAAISTLLFQFPNLPPRVLVTLLAVSICDGGFAPRKICACGCGETVTGRAALKTSACRKRVQRQRDKLKPKVRQQFNLVFQYELI